MNPNAHVDRLIVTALARLEQTFYDLRPTRHGDPGYAQRIIERAADEMRRLRPFWSELDRRKLWDGAQAIGHLEVDDFGRDIRELPKEAAEKRAWFSRIESTCCPRAKRRPSRWPS